MAAPRIERWTNKDGIFEYQIINECVDGSVFRLFGVSVSTYSKNMKDIVYKDRVHALFVAFAPYSDPKYAISVVVEHGGTGSGSAAPIAKKIIKKVLERDDLRNSQIYKNGKEI